MEPSAAVLLAGGTGSRFGESLPKQLVKLAGQPVLYHTLRKFDDANLFSSVVVAANPEWADEIAEIAHSALRKVPFEIVNGGDSRNASVSKAIDSLTTTGKLLVHDGVRPLVSEQLLRDTLNALTRGRCVIPVIASVDPVVVVEGDRVLTFLDRARTYRGQSPQGFWIEDLRAALRQERQTGWRHETLFEAISVWDPTVEVLTIPGDLNNLKITLPADHMVAGRLLLEE